MIPAGPQIKLLAPVLSNRMITPGSYILSFQAAEIAGTARPGQFVMVRCGTGSERVLRRPLGIHRVNFTGPAKGEVSLLYSVVGSGTRWLSELKAGEYIDILGPLGNGFSLGPANRRLLLVAGGIGFSPLNFLAAEAVKKSIKVTLLLGAGTARDLYPEELLPQDIESVLVTEDGSTGEKGLVTDYLQPFLPGVDQVCACGPVGMYRAIAARRKLWKETPVQVSLETRLGCGIGACFGCTVKTRTGLKRVCRDGPVFDIDEILWSEVKI